MAAGAAGWSTNRHRPLPRAMATDDRTKPLAPPVDHATAVADHATVVAEKSLGTKQLKPTMTPPTRRKTKVYRGLWPDWFDGQVPNHMGEDSREIKFLGKTAESTIFLGRCICSSNPLGCGSTPKETCA
jgi:hypothetical protein